MGMAASQARLLSITARIHDVEFQAQTLQDAKLALATQEDAVYKNYLAALDETTLTLRDWEGNRVAVTFNNLCGARSIDSVNSYALRDSKGKLLVSDAVAEAYEKYGKTAVNGYMFAFAALGYDSEEFNINTFAANIYLNHREDGSNAIDEMTEIYKEMSDILAQNSIRHGDDFCADLLVNKNTKSVITEKDLNKFSAPFKSVSAAIREGIEAGATGLAENNSPDYARYKELESRLQNIVYASYEEEFLQEASREARGITLDGNGLSSLGKEFAYYVNVFNQIKSCGGCTRISDYNGVDGDAANDGEWLQNMIQCGKITIWTVETDKKRNKVELKSTGVSSDSYLEYTVTSTLNKSHLAKAEAEYEYQMKQIQNKDKKFDMNLSKLEAERTALAKQYDALKTIVNDNINRTYNVFGGS